MVDLKVAKKFENKEDIKLVLKNNFVYSNIKYKINEDGLIEFFDRRGETIRCEPSFVALISEVTKNEVGDYGG